MTVTVLVMYFFQSCVKQLPHTVMHAYNKGIIFMQAVSEAPLLLSQVIMKKCQCSSLTLSANGEHENSISCTLEISKIAQQVSGVKQGTCRYIHGMYASLISAFWQTDSTHNL